MKSYPQQMTDILSHKDLYLKFRGAHETFETIKIHISDFINDSTNRMFSHEIIHTIRIDHDGVKKHITGAIELTGAIE